MQPVNEIVHIQSGDVIEALGLRSYRQLRKRIDDGIYPTPETTQGGRYVYTLGWLTIAEKREADLKAVMARVVQRKQRYQRLDNDLKDMIST